MTRLIATALLTAGLASTACGSPGPPAASPASLAAQGRALARSKGCASCHSVDGSRRTGPTWKGLAGSTVTLEDGSTVVADDAYLHESIADPDAKTVKGYPRGVMAEVVRPGSLTEPQIKALVAYISSLGG